MHCADCNNTITLQQVIFAEELFDAYWCNKCYRLEYEEDEEEDEPEDPVEYL
jgi:hypothetical protein